jgi:hypothetical protein
MINKVANENLFPINVSIGIVIKNKRVVKIKILNKADFLLAG